MVVPVPARTSCHFQLLVSVERRENLQALHLHYFITVQVFAR